MKDNTASVSSLTHDLLMSLLLLTLSTLGGWLVFQSMNVTGGMTVHTRLFFILLVHPFAMAAWVFCGLPGLGLAMKSLFGAIEQRKAIAGVFSVGLLALSLACASLWN